MKQPRPRPPRKIWPWLLLLTLAGVLIVVAAAGALFFGEDTPAPVKPRITIKPNQGAMTQQEMQEKMEVARSTPAPDPADEARRTIEQHRARIDAEPNAPERPALLQAMGNLYGQKLMDYENAAWCYEQIILNYPKWEGTPMIYGSLATCYEKTGDQENATRVYMEMMRVLPETTQEYLYAKDKLGL